MWTQRLLHQSLQVTLPAPRAPDLHDLCTYSHIWTMETRGWPWNRIFNGKVDGGWCKILRGEKWPPIRGQKGHELNHLGHDFFEKESPLPGDIPSFTVSLYIPASSGFCSSRAYWPSLRSYKLRPNTKLHECPLKRDHFERKDRIHRIFIYAFEGKFRSSLCGIVRLIPGEFLPPRAGASPKC